jgi:hypothetical protein
MLIWFNRPKNKEELFNLRHASARNVIERSFGVTKNRFNILDQPPRYLMLVQTYILSALCALHNFIFLIFIYINPMSQDEVEVKEDKIDLTQFGNLGFGVITREMQNRASRKRDEIASNMWREYTAFLVDDMDM